MSTVFDIPPEDEDHPDTPCPAVLDEDEVCGKTLRWCPACEGYHHLDEEFWIIQHYTREVINPESGIGHYRFNLEKPCSIDGLLEALSLIKEK